jgi:hypothetical protein
MVPLPGHGLLLTIYLVLDYSCYGIYAAGKSGIILDFEIKGTLVWAVSGSSHAINSCTASVASVLTPCLGIVQECSTSDAITMIRIN